MIWLQGQLFLSKAALLFLRMFGQLSRIPLLGEVVQQIEVTEFGL